MVNVNINSGEFPLMRNVDYSKQPERADVYNEWIKAFAYNVPKAVDNLADIIEDVYSFELWKDNYMDTPEEFFERMGIIGLDLEEPAKLIKELRKKRSTKKHEIMVRAARAKELRDQGMTQQQIAEELGVHRNTVGNDLCTEKPARAQKTVQPKKVRFELWPGTAPETAAAKIIDKFGQQYASDLAAAISLRLAAVN